MRVLEICPYEPPASGWVNRVKLLRRLIKERGGTCEILDVGPSRKITGRDCLPVMSGWDYLSKLLGFSRRHFIMHCHVNGEYFRGLLLALAACVVARLFRNRCLVTFHAGAVQLFLRGWRRRVIGPIFWLIFSLAHVVICNSEAVKSQLLGFQKASKFAVIPAFSSQYLEYERVTLDTELERFLCAHSPVLSTYLCFREGFFTEVVIQGMAELITAWPLLGIVIVGTGSEEKVFKDHVFRGGLETHFYLAGDLNHDAFLTLMSRSDVHLRTPVTDGVSATVLEALSLRIPLVASENDTRPATVVTYKATDPQDLSQKIDWVLRHRDAVVTSLEFPEIVDTAKTEVDLILGLSTCVRAPC